MLSAVVWGASARVSADDSDLATGEGHYTVPAGQNGFIIYDQPYSSVKDINCEETKDACAGFVSSSNRAAEVVDCKMMPEGACPTMSILPDGADPSKYVYVHFSYKTSIPQCVQTGAKMGLGKGWCERDKSFFSFFENASVEENSGNGWVRKDAVVLKPYVDPKDPSKKVKIPADQALVYCTDCIPDPTTVTPETTGKIFKQVEKVKQAAVSNNGCKLYDAASSDLKEACSENQHLEYLPGMKFSTSLTDDGKCALCFYGGRDVCGDTRFSRGRKIEDLSAVLVKRSSALCNIAQRQFESNCGVWKASGTVEDRRAKTFDALKRQIASFTPSDEDKSRSMRPPLMACLLNAENQLFEPNSPTSLTCDAKRFNAAEHAALAQFAAMLARHGLSKSKVKDYLKSCSKLKDKGEDLELACEDVAHFTSITDWSRHRPSEVMIPAIKNYYANYSSAAGLTMLVRKTTQWLYSDPDAHGNPGPPVLKNYCKDFSSYWASMDSVRKNTFFPRHKCVDAPNGDALFEKMSDDPTLQLMSAIKLFNYYLNDSGNAVRPALEKWFGKRNPAISGVLACSACMSKKNADVSECVSLTTRKGAK